MTDDAFPEHDPGFAELEAEGWTDLHLHPSDGHWSLPLDQLADLIAAMGAQRLALLTMHGVEDLWDDGSAVPEPLFEQEQVAVADLPALLRRDDVRHLTAVLDPAEVGMLPLMAHCQSADWHACLLSLGWGLTTVPDPDCQRTAARFRFSLAVGGPGVPPRFRDFARSAPQDTAISSACQDLSIRLGTPCKATVTFGE